MIQDKSASSRSQGFLFWPCLCCTWSSRLWASGKSHLDGVVPTFLGDSTALHLAFRLQWSWGEPRPIEGYLSQHVASLLPPQTILSAGSQSNNRPQVSYTWCRAPWLPGPGLTRSTQQQHKTSSNAKKSQHFLYNITSSAFHSIIWYCNHKNVLKANSIKKRKGMRSVAENL